MARNQWTPITEKEWVTIENELEKAFATDFSIAEACAHADVSVTNYLKRIAAKPDVKERMERAKHKIYQVAKTSVFNKVKSDGNTALRFLERTQKEKYSPRLPANTWWGWTQISLKELYQRAKEISTDADTKKKKKK